MTRLRPWLELLWRRDASACCVGLAGRCGWDSCSCGAVGGGGGGGNPLPLAAGVAGWARGPYVWIWIASPTFLTLVSSPAGRSYRRLGLTGTVMDCAHNGRGSHIIAATSSSSWLRIIVGSVADCSDCCPLLRKRISQNCCRIPMLCRHEGLAGRGAGSDGGSPLAVCCRCQAGCAALWGPAASVPCMRRKSSEFAPCRLGNAINPVPLQHAITDTTLVMVRLHQKCGLG